MIWFVCPFNNFSGIRFNSIRDSGFFKTYDSFPDLIMVITALDSIEANLKISNHMIHQTLVFGSIVA